MLCAAVTMIAQTPSKGKKFQIKVKPRRQQIPFSRLPTAKGKCPDHLNGASLFVLRPYVDHESYNLLFWNIALH
jgi:hypothetical protein